MRTRPTGLSRLEPVSVLVFAVLWRRSLYKSSRVRRHDSRPDKVAERPEAGALVIAIIVTVIGTKLCLHIWCQRVAAKGGADTGLVRPG